MTLREIIYNIKDSIGSDAEELTNSQYKFIIDYYRAKLIRQRVTKGERLATTFSPPISKIPIEPVDIDDPGCVLMDCSMYKTTQSLPAILPYTLNTTLMYVGATDGFLPFQETSFQALQFEQHAKFISKQPKWFLLGDKLYIVNPPDEQIGHITIQGIFEDPLEAAALCEDFNNECRRNFDFDYPISADMIDTIYKLMVDNELKGLIQEIDEDEGSQR